MPPPPAGALEHDGIADARGLACGRLEIASSRCRAAAERPASSRDVAGGVLQAEGSHLRGRGPDEDDAGGGAGFGEVGIFAEEAVAGMDGLGAGRARPPR